MNTTAQAIDVTPTARIAPFSGDRAAAISYTFDDGLRDQYTIAVPMLNEVGFKATFFIIPASTVETPEDGEKKQELKRAWGGISWPELKIMAAQGHEIASHTWSHPNLQTLTIEEVDSQLSKSFETIKTRIGQPPLTLAFPFNASTAEIQAAALKYHLSYRAYQTSISGKSTPQSLNSWADKLIQENKLGIIMAHGIATGYAALTDPEIFRTHLRYVKSRERDIWVDTFANISRYQKERENAELTVSGKNGNVTCILSGTLDPQLYNVPLTIVFDDVSATSAKATQDGEMLSVRVESGSIYLQTLPSSQPISVTWK